MNINEIEKNHSVEKLEVNKLKLWPFVRFKIFEELRKTELVSSRIQKLNFNVVKILIKNLFYGSSNLFKLFTANIWVFSSSGNRKFIDGKAIDRVAEDIIELYESSIIIENPISIGKHYNFQELKNKNLISQSGFFLFTFLFSKLLKIKSIDGLDELDKVLGDKVNINFYSQSKLYLGQYHFMRFLLKIHKPKLVFFVYSASSIGYIKAFKDFKIPVIELQHGVINYEHKAYQIAKDFGNGYFPDYLFTYGNIEKDYFGNNNFFIDKDKIFATGYSFLEKVKGCKFSEEGDIFVKKYSSKKIICISFQEPYSDILIPILVDLAKMNTDIIYLLIPRNLNKIYENLPNNLIVEYKINVYEALRICDIHLTINSTCALEAFTFGKPTILVNAFNYASNYYGETFKNLKSVVFTEPNVDDIIEVIENHSFPNSNEIILEGEGFFKPNFCLNLQENLKIIETTREN